MKPDLMTDAILLAMQAGSAARRRGSGLFPMGLVINTRPVAIVPAQIHQQVNGVQKPANPGLSGVALVVVNETGTVV